MPDHEVPGSNSRNSQLHILHHLRSQLTSNPTGILEKSGSYGGAGHHTSSGTRTGSVQSSSGPVQPSKKIKNDPEQHIPDEILNDLYSINYTSYNDRRESINDMDDQDHSVPNQEVPELDKDSAIDEFPSSKPLDYSKPVSKPSRKQQHPQSLSRTLSSALPHHPHTPPFNVGNGQMPQVLNPYCHSQASLYSAYPNPLSFANDATSWNRSWQANAMLGRGAEMVKSHYHPYNQPKLIPKEPPKSLGSAPLDALNSCVNNLNPTKVSPTLTAKTKSDCTIKTEPRLEAPSSSSSLNEAPQPSQQPAPTKNEKNEGDPVPAHKRGGVQLWQFLRQLLDNPERRNIIHWTRQGHDGEFKLLDPEEVARLWGCEKKRPAMNYDKLSRSIRYYYEKGIMQKVPGERYVYKFLPDTMQAVNPFTNQLALNYSQDMPWGAFPNPPVPNPQMPTGFPHPSYSDFYAHPHMQQLLALQYNQEYNQSLPGYHNLTFPPQWNHNTPYPE